MNPLHLAPAWGCPRPASVSWLRAMLGLAALWLGGCASPTPTPTTSSGAPTLVIAVQVAGGARPTAQQVAMIYQVLSTNPRLAGYRFVNRTRDADYMLVAVFTPDALDQNQGNISVKEIVPSNNLTARVRRPSNPDPIATAQESQQQLEAWARSRESTFPRP